MLRKTIVEQYVSIRHISDLFNGVTHIKDIISLRLQ